MTKIDLTAAPYFDDYDEKKKFYKILFRPGRSVQARELTQIQSTIQKQVSRLGKHWFEKNALVFPRTSFGCKYDTSSFFIKVAPEATANTHSEAAIISRWLNKKITVTSAPSGVEGTVIGYHIDGDISSPTGGGQLRFFVSLTKASPERNTFQRNDEISVNYTDTISGATTNSVNIAKIVNESNAVGRICSVEIPESIYFYNEYFVLVDTQYFFIAPDDTSKNENWNIPPSCEIGIEMRESITTFEDDLSLLDNANGSSNFSAPGADRLKIEGVLTKKSFGSTDQNFIKLLALKDGIITEAPQLEKDPYADPFKSYLATRTKEESGDYTVSPFIAKTKELLTSDPTGLYREEELSFVNYPDDLSKDLDSKKKAGNLSVNLFNVPLHPTDKTPQIFKKTFSDGKPDRYYPGTSYDNLAEPTSFKNLCSNRIGVVVEPGVAYVQGYRYSLLGETRVSVERSRTSDIIFNARVQAPIGNFLYVTSIFGFPPISGSQATDYYKKVDLYSTLIENPLLTPDTKNKVGTARIFAFDFFSGAVGTTNAVYKLGVFDIELLDGKKASDIRSIHTTGGAVGTFSANLSMVDVSITPSLQFKGLINFVEPTEIQENADATNYAITYDASGKVKLQAKTNANSAALKGYYDTGVFNVGTVISIRTQSAAQKINDTHTDTTRIVTATSFTAATSGATPSEAYIELSIDSSLTNNDDPILVKTSHKVRGTGTSWRSAAGESLKKGDQVAIGSGSNTTIYTVFSDPMNDNELNLTPDPQVATNSPWKSENGSVMQYLVAETLQEVNVGNAGLVFKLPHNTLRTIRAGTKNAPDNDIPSLTFTSRRVWTEQQPQISGGVNSFSISSGTSETFLQGTYGYYVSDSTGKSYNLNVGARETPPSSPNTIILVQNSTVVEFVLPYSESSTTTFNVCAPVERNIGPSYQTTAKEKTKVLKTDGHKSAAAGEYNNISLGKADVFRIIKITDSGSTTKAAQKEDKDISGSYILDDGQRDYYYGIASIKLRPGSSKPTGRIGIWFEYFDHQGAGEYFSIDSYPWEGGPLAGNLRYDEIPTYISSKYGEFDLRGCLDFRPRLHDAGVNFSAYSESPLDSISLTYHVYESRKDKLYIDTLGNIKVKKGSPGIISQPPEDPLDGMVLYDLHLSPYTPTHKSCTMMIRDNRRYTMKDIGKLEDRIKTLEYYTSLSLLETDTKDLVIKDALGQDKFKHGFMTDNFENASKSDLDDPDFSAALETMRRELRPKIAESFIPLKEVATNNSERKIKKYTKTDTIFTLPYTHEPYLEQSLCSRVINVNPYQSQSFIGGINISPWTDTWRETEIADPLVVQDDTAYKAAAASYDKNGESILWLGTRQEWTGLDTKNRQKADVVNIASHAWPANKGEYLDEKGNLINGTGVPRNDQLVMVPLGKGYKNEGKMVKYRESSAEGQVWNTTTTTMTGSKWEEGIKSKLIDAGFSNPISMGSRIKDVRSSNFIRSSTIKFEGYGFRPGSRLYAFFDGKNVTRYCHPDSNSGGRTENKDNIQAGPFTDNTNLRIKFGTSSIEFSGNHQTTSKYDSLGVTSGGGYVNSLGNIAWRDANAGSALHQVPPVDDNSILQGDGVVVYRKASAGSNPIYSYYLKGLNTKFKQDLKRYSVVSINMMFTAGTGATPQHLEVQLSESPTKDDEVEIYKPPFCVEETVVTAPTYNTYYKAFDKTEYLERLYVGKFVDIKNSSDATHNIIDKRIDSISYTPKFGVADQQGASPAVTDYEKQTPSTLKFVFSGLNMVPTASAEFGNNLTLTIKKSATSTAPGDATSLTCDSTGTVKGNFIIPDPKTPGNPQFNTGDRYFRLTSSENNENTPDVTRADARYSATGWIDVTQETLHQTKQFTVTQETIQTEKEKIKLTDQFRSLAQVIPMDPIAQSFFVPEEEGIFITAVDIFFYSKDPSLPIRFQIRPLDDGGNPSVNLIYEKFIPSNEVVVNKVDLATQRIKVLGATSPNAIAGFNKPPWNQEIPNDGEKSDIMKVYSKNVRDGKAPIWPGDEEAAQNSGNWFSYSVVDGAPDPSGDMIPTRVVFDYPIYLQGNNKYYSFVLLTDSVQGPGPVAEALESTYQVYIAQAGVNEAGTNETASPVHLIKPLEPDQKDQNYILGTQTQMSNLGSRTGVFFKSIDGVSWESDQEADIKYTIHKANFDTNFNGEIAISNDVIPQQILNLDPFQTKAGSSKIRVTHRNHNIPAGGRVRFTGIDESANLNGMPYHILANTVHVISNPSLDSYIIDLVDHEATTTGFMGGGTVRASNNYRFEEFLLNVNPTILPDTDITWRIGATTSQTPYDPSASPYKKIQEFNFTPNTDVTMPLSAQVYSPESEAEDFPGGATFRQKNDKSLTIYATLSSKKSNVSPILNLDRLSMIGKSVRLDDPYGKGTTNNINDNTFDEYVCLPNSEVIDPSSKIYFTDTNNTLTGSKFVSSGNTITGVGSLFSMELNVGDIVKHPATLEQAKVVEVVSNTQILVDADISLKGTDGLGESSLIYNPPYLKIKTADGFCAKHLSNLDVGKFLTVTGTTNRDFSEQKILSVKYTPNATQGDPQLSNLPCLCEVVVEHFFASDVQSGFESSSTLKISQLEKFIDEVAPTGGSVSAKYISRTMRLQNSANCLKVMFDGCRPEFSNIDLYYRTAAQTDSEKIGFKNWNKLEYSIEKNGTLEYVVPETNASHSSFSAYEANALQITPFTLAQVKIIMRGGKASLYPKIKNLRIIALEE